MTWGEKVVSSAGLLLAVCGSIVAIAIMYSGMASAITLEITGNATGCGLHVLEVTGPTVIGNMTSWTVMAA